jgi:hypothetical protein
MKRFFAVLGGTTFALIFASAGASAEDCPTAVKGRGAFVVERGEPSKTEVTFGDGAVVNAVFRFEGKTLLETKQYEGLIQLERFDKGRRTIFKPRSDLSKLFPLTPKQQIGVQLDVSEEGIQPSIVTVDLRMTGTDSLTIGACKYDVLKFERIEARQNKKSEPVTEYYAPELKFVVAKEYRERDGRTTLIKYDRIYRADR